MVRATVSWWVGEEGGGQRIVWVQVCASYDMSVEIPSDCDMAAKRPSTRCAQHGWISRHGSLLGVWAGPDAGR